MTEEAFAETCLRMEAAYTALRQARPVSGNVDSEARIVQPLQVIRACRQQLIREVGERRASFFEQLIKAQVLEEELASDTGTSQHQKPHAACSVSSFLVHAYLSLDQCSNTEELFL